MEESYIDMLKQEYIDRKKRRPSYSERAYARDLKLSSGYISLLFNNKRDLSPKMSFKILENLSWKEEKSKKFIDSVKEQHFKIKKKDKEPASSEVKKYEMDHDYFKLIANVNHFLILEFIQTRKVKSKKEIIKYFGIDEIECDLVLKRLERLKLVDFKNEKYIAINENRHLKGTPSQAIRNYHKESISRSLDSVEKQSFEDRELRSVSLSLDKNKIDEAKKSIDKFVKNFMKKYANHIDGEIYQLNLQLFCHKQLLSKKEEKQ